MNDELKKQIEKLIELSKQTTERPWINSPAKEWEFDQESPFSDHGADIYNQQRVTVVVGGYQEEQGGAVGVLKNIDAEYITLSANIIPTLIEEIKKGQVETEKHLILISKLSQEVEDLTTQHRNDEKQLAQVKEKLNDSIIQNEQHIIDIKRYRNALEEIVRRNNQTWKMNNSRSSQYLDEARTIANKALGNDKK